MVPLPFIAWAFWKQLQRNKAQAKQIKEHQKSEIEHFQRLTPHKAEDLSTECHGYDPHFRESMGRIAFLLLKRSLIEGCVASNSAPQKL